MQIHEITRRRTDEGILSNIKTKIGQAATAVGNSTIGKAATAVAQTAAGSVLDAAGVSKDLQGWNKGMKATPGQTQAQAMKAGQALIIPTAKTLTQNWQQALAAWAKELDPKIPDWNKLKDTMGIELDNIINKKLLQGNVGWQNLTDYMKQFPGEGLLAQGIQQDIAKARDQVLTLTNKSSPAQINKAFTDLVTYVFQAQNQLQTSQSSSSVAMGGNKLTQILAANKMTAQQMNLNQTQIQAIHDTLKGSPQQIALATAITGQNPPGAQV